MTLEAKIKRGNLLVTEISIDTGEKPLSHSLILLQSKVNNYLSQMINSGDDGNGQSDDVCNSDDDGSEYELPPSNLSELKKKSDQNGGLSKKIKL